MELTEHPPLSRAWVSLALTGIAVGLAVPLMTWMGLWTSALIMVGVAAAMVIVVCASSIDIFSPALLFTMIWAMCVVIGMQIISAQQQPWNATVWICVVGAPIAFWVGDLMARLMLHSPGGELGAGCLSVAPWPPKTLLRWGLVWWGFALLTAAYEFKTIVGGVPILMENWEEARMTAAEGYLGRAIHAIAYSSIALAIVVQVGLLTQRRLISWETLPLWLLWFMSIGLAALWGSRHTLFVPFAAGAISLHLLRVRLGTLRLLALGVLGLAFLGIVAYIRTAGVWEQEEVSWQEVLSDIGYGGWHPLLAQVHQTVAINFEIFRRLTETIPEFVPFHMGGYTFHAVYSLLPGTQLTLAQWQNEYWNTQFYGSLTSTHMGPLYADFGIAGVFLWTAAFALIMRMLYISMRRRPSRAKVVWFSFLTVQLIMMPYDNTMVKLAFWFQMLILWGGLIALGAHRQMADVDLSSAVPFGGGIDKRENSGNG